MTNLFSSFDPSVGTSLNLPLNWASVFVVFFLPASFWVSSSKPLELIKMAMMILEAEIKLVNKKSTSNSISLILVSLFTLLLMNNFMGLLPYVFTASSHLAFTIPFSVTLWVGYLIFSSIFNFGSFLAHLVPKGTPFVLVPFMVIIEIISTIMRPLTLGIRLAANMIAGHLLLILTTSSMPVMSFPLFLTAFLGLLLLMTLEVGVSFIQSYVFTSLKSLYVSEVGHPNL